MASPMSSAWWSTFLDAHGRDSEEETAFTGYLTTQQIDPGADPGVLEQAYADFLTFMADSEGREADRGPRRAELVAQQAVAQVEQQFVPKSRVSMPGVEKPLVAATRPADTREPLVASAPGPEGQAQLTPAGEHGEASRPEVSGEPPTQPQPHATTTRSEPTPAPHDANAEARGGRPAETREPLAASAPGPEGQAQLVPAGEHGASSRPEVSGESPAQPQPHATTTRSEPTPAPHDASSESHGGRRGRRGDGN